MMKQLTTGVTRIIHRTIERIGIQAVGSKNRFPWTLKQLLLGPAHVRTVVRQPGTRVFLLRDGKEFDLHIYIWKKNGWENEGALFAVCNDGGGVNIQDVRIDHRGKGYGTLLVKKCLVVSAAMGASHVEGFLSSVDDVPRLAIFYGRLGFDVTLDKTGDSGHIIKHFD